jgi:hypothetical protein
MKKQLLLAVMSLALVSGAHAQLETLALDVGANYGGSGEPAWANGTNGGFGFKPWSFFSSGGGFKGNFIGDPSFAGISGMSTESFALYANPTSSAALIIANRELTTPLQVGETFSFQFGMNGTSGAGGIKEIEIQYRGNYGWTDLATVYNSGTDNTVWFYDGSSSETVDTGFGYGTIPMTWSFTYTSPTNLFVTANDRDGSGTFTTNIYAGGGIGRFNLRAYQLEPGDANQPYFNNFTVTVPEPSTYALLGLGALALGGRVLRRRNR